MEELSFTEVLAESWGAFIVWIARATPKVLAGLLVLLIGWLLAKLLRYGLVKLLRMAKLEDLSERAGIEGFLRRGNIQGGTVVLLGNLVYWLLLLLTLVAAVTTMGLGAAQDVFDDVVQIIPSVIVSVVVLIVGLSFAAFISNAVQTAAVNAQIRQARFLGNASRYAIIVLVGVVALSQLGVATELLGQAVLILFGAICFGLALAFGLGCKELAGEIAREAWDRERVASDALAKAGAETDKKKKS